MTRAAAFLGPLLIFVAAMLWASDAPFRLHLTQSLSSDVIVLGEHLFDCLIAIPILAWGWKELRGLSLREWTAIAFIGVFGSAVASIAFTESFHYVNPSVAILLQKVQPLVAIALAWRLLGEVPHRSFWIWSMLALCGAYLISFPGLVPQTYAGEAFKPDWYGALLALAAAVLWAASTVLGKYALRAATFSTVTALRFVIALIFLSVLNASHGTLVEVVSLSVSDWLFVLVIALCSGVVSLFLYYYALSSTRASIATIAELGFPFAAVFVNAYFIPGNWAPGTYWGLAIGQWAGTAILLVAVVMLGRVNRDERKQDHLVG